MSTTSVLSLSLLHSTNTHIESSKIFSFTIGEMCFDGCISCMQKILRISGMGIAVFGKIDRIKFIHTFLIDLDCVYDLPVLYACAGNKRCAYAYVHFLYVFSIVIFACVGYHTYGIVYTHIFSSFSVVAVDVDVCVKKKVHRFAMLGSQSYRSMVYQE